MKCPICKGKARTKDKRDTIYSSTHRRYECEECLTPFTSVEKVDFNSIPKYLRDTYLKEGKF